MRMKKIFTLLLALAGVVSTASATEYVLAGSSAIANGQEWNNNADVNKMILADATHYYIVVQNCDLSTGTKYSWQIVEKGTWNITARWDDYYVSEDGTYTMIFIYNTDGTTRVIPVKNLTLSNNYGSNNTWNVDNSSFYFTYSKGTTWTINVDAKDVSSAWRFRIWTSGISSTDTWHNIAADSEGEALAFATDDDAAYANNSTTNSWEVAYPSSYAFDHYTISVKYDVVNYKWIVRADACIAKTANGTNAGTKLGYSTFGAETDVDLSSLPSGVTAHTATVGAKGIITYNTATELAAGEGVLLTNTTGSNVNLSIPVKASATPNGSNNLVRVASAALLQTTDDGSGKYYKNYILTKTTVPNPEGDADLGWYLVNDDGCNSLTVGTAYLKVLKETPSSPSRAFFPLWSEEPDGVKAVATDPVVDGQAYNLAGQRVAKTTKGLYIVNGKKVMVK